MWDFQPPKESIYSFGNYFDGAKFGVVLAAIGLIPYWIFHMIKGDAFNQWHETDKKLWRVTWVFCWAFAVGYFFSRSLAI